MEYHIRTEGLGKIFKNRGVAPKEALKSLSIEVPAGTVMGFLGRNGAGKTTTIKILLGLVKATQGSGELMGRSIEEDFAREGVAYMPELPTLDSRDTPIEFLRLIGRVSKMDMAQIKERIPIVMEEVGLSDKMKVKFGDFSKGMKQRMELAQAILSNPRLLILDEPFSGLDPIGRREIRDLILRYNKERGTTVFFSSHILTDVEIMCDSLGILDYGELKAIGLKDDLLGVGSIEISGNNVDPTGMMFLEKMAERSVRDHDRFSVFITPNRDPGKVRTLFEKYGATDIQIEKKCKSLEEFFMATIDADRKG